RCRPFASARHRYHRDVKRTAGETRGEQVDLSLQPADSELPYQQADAGSLAALAYCRGRARAHGAKPSIGTAVDTSAARERFSVTARSAIRSKATARPKNIHRPLTA